MEHCTFIASLLIMDHIWLRGVKLRELQFNSESIVNLRAVFKPLT